MKLKRISKDDKNKVKFDGPDVRNTESIVDSFRAITAERDKRSTNQLTKSDLPDGHTNSEHVEAIMEESEEVKIMLSEIDPVFEDDWSSKGFKSIPSDILRENQWSKTELDNETFNYIVDISKCSLSPEQIINKLQKKVIITSKKIKIDQLVNDEGFDYSKDFS